MRHALLLLLTLPAVAGRAGAQNVRPSSKIGNPEGPRGVAGTYKNVENTFEVTELPGGRVSLDFVGFWPNVRRAQRRRRGVDTLNVGSFTETAPLRDGVATVRPGGVDSPCVIRIRFLPGKLRVTQEGGPGDCGFGFNVTADGVYVRAERAASRGRRR